MPLSTNFFSAVLALGAVIALVILAGRIARSTGLTRSRAGARLAILETLPIDRTRSVRIVRCDGREILLLVGGGSDVLLGWLPGPELPR